MKKDNTQQTSDQKPKKKRGILFAVIAVIAVFAIIGSMGGDDTSADGAKSSAPVSSGAVSSEPEKPVEPDEPEVIDAGEIGDYYVTIKDCAFGEDYEGNKMIVINYDFTNNSEESATALWSIATQAFQDGVELETAIAMDASVYDAGVAQKEIKPGITIENCQIAYVLTSESPVEFEVTGFMSLNEDEKLVKTFNVQ